MSETKWALESEHQSWLVLDGIRTRMIETNAQFPEIRVYCECGYRKLYAVGAHRQDPVGEREQEHRAALRFHYTHCPKARAAHQGGDSER